MSDARADSARVASADREPPSDPAGEWHPYWEQRRDSHHLRSLAEMGGGLALGSVLYWLMMDRNVADWDNPTPEERFDGRAWVLDNNSLAVNFIAHPMMGGAAYSFARANHHGVAASFGYTFLTSFLWEFVLEFKEKVSVNDVIVTPGTGLPIGEFLYKLGLYLDTARSPGVGTHIARWSLGTGVALDRALDARPAPRVKSRDALGFSQQIWHAFELDYGVGVVRSPALPDYVRHSAGARGRLVTLPGYLLPGDRSRFFHRAEISDFALDVEASSHGGGGTISADTLLLGYHTQSMRGTPRAPTGYAATFGASVAYFYLKSKANDLPSYHQTERLPEPDLDHHVPIAAEQLSAFHMPGPAFEWQLRAPHVALWVGARGHPDFVGLGAPAFYDWAAANPNEKGKHILHRQGYFYGWGVSGKLFGKLSLGPFRLAAEVFHGRYRSQDGLDRHIERITADVPAKGNVLFYSTSLGVRPPLLPLTLSVEASVRRWHSEVGGFQRTDRIAERGLRLSYDF